MLCFLNILNTFLYWYIFKQERLLSTQKRRILLSIGFVWIGYTEFYVTTKAFNSVIIELIRKQREWSFYAFFFFFFLLLKVIVNKVNWLSLQSMTRTQWTLSFFSEIGKEGWEVYHRSFQTDFQQLFFFFLNQTETLTFSQLILLT